MEAHNFVLSALQILEHALDNGRLHQAGVHRTEIFLRCQIHQHRVFLAAQALAQIGGDGGRPVGIKVLARRVGQRRAHFQAVGLHQVERAQHAVQAAQNAHLLLRPGQLCRRQAVRVEAGVDVAIESQHGLARIALGGAARPGLVTRHIEGAELVTEVHQVGNLGRRAGAQEVNQPGRLGHKQGSGVRLASQRRFIIERFGRRQ